MCGIAGIWHLAGNAVAPEKIRAFTDSLFDRGPDGGGYEFFSNNSLALGHRRLSILDLSENGRQPMSYGEGRYWITFNGEIFNFIELKKELEQKGYAFKTSSDTEVLLAAYDCWHSALLEKLNGMFAFAIYDTSKNSLFLARDRFGVKPLHYMHRPGRDFAFASETYAFGFLHDFQKRVNTHRMAMAIDDSEYLEGSGHTIFDDIYQLLPGHYMEITPRSGLVQKKWWETLSHKTAVPSSYNEQVERFYELFSDACRIRLRSDVPVASALSGGMDSSSIYCTVNSLLSGMSQLERLPASVQEAFIAYYPGTPNDEKVYADEVINYTGGKATYIETDYSNLLNELVKTTERFDAIGGTPIMCATDVYKAMRQKHYKVSMDGHGADEMLYGYKQMVFDAYQTAVLKGDAAYQEDLRNTYAGLFFPAERDMAYQYLGNYGNTIRPRGVKRLARSLAPGFFEGREQFNIPAHNASAQMLDPWLSREFNRALPLLSADHTRLFESGNAEQRTYNMFHYTSLPLNLRDFDRASMQSSIEIRSPFMDWRLVSFVFSLPLSSKLGGGFTKRILRDAMKGKMPENIRTRKLKIGLSAPLASWFNGQMKQFLLDEVSSQQFQANGLWNGKAIKEHLLSKQQTGWDDFIECSRLWRFINANIILKNHKD